MLGAFACFVCTNPLQSPFSFMVRQQGHGVLEERMRIGCSLCTLRSKQLFTWTISVIIQTVSTGLFSHTVHKQQQQQQHISAWKEKQYWSKWVLLLCTYIGNLLQQLKNVSTINIFLFLNHNILLNLVNISSYAVILNYFTVTKKAYNFSQRKHCFNSQ